jgi:hypothetical protein
VVFSAQYRLIEFCCTDLINLIDHRFRATIDRTTPYDHAFEHLYWQAAGKDYTTGKNLIYYKNLNASIKIFSASNGTIQFHQYLAKIQTITRSRSK